MRRSMRTVSYAKDSGQGSLPSVNSLIRAARSQQRAGDFEMTRSVVRRSLEQWSIRLLNGHDCYRRAPLGATSRHIP